MMFLINRCTLFIFLSLGGSELVTGQSLYFPPVVGEQWETVAPADLGWCEERIDDLYDHLADNNTKAFMVLQGGRIVLEKYFDAFTKDSIWYWASAGKTLTGFLVGMAQEQGFLAIDEPAGQYLGDGWTSCLPSDELQRTIRHQLTMTTGLDDAAGDPDCTLPACLTCIAEPGTRWAYHNAPYTLLDGVIEGATGQNLNAFVQQQLRTRTGINGLFVHLGYNNVFFSRPRHMARFGLLMLADGTWDGVPVLADTAYLGAMTRPSQFLNPSYGYLTWLNGQAGYMLPGLQFVFQGSLMPDAPDDMYMALGKNGQYINVVPGLDLVLIRMGNAPDNALVPVLLNNEIWQFMNEIMCPATAVDPIHTGNGRMVRTHFTGQEVVVEWGDGTFKATVFDLTGRVVASGMGMDGILRLPVQDRAVGMYFVHVESRDRGALHQATGRVVIGE